jgi:hypothetical protein
MYDIFSASLNDCLMRHLPTITNVMAIIPSRARFPYYVSPLFSHGRRVSLTYAYSYISWSLVAQ